MSSGCGSCAVEGLCWDVGSSWQADQGSVVAPVLMICSVCTQLLPLPSWELVGLGGSHSLATVRLSLKRAGPARGQTCGQTSNKRVDNAGSNAWHMKPQLVPNTTEHVSMLMRSHFPGSMFGSHARVHVWYSPAEPGLMKCTPSACQCAALWLWPNTTRCGWCCLMRAAAAGSTATHRTGLRGGGGDAVASQAENDGTQARGWGVGCRWLCVI